MLWFTIIMVLCLAAQPRALPAAGPARLLSIKGVVVSAEPLKNRAVGSRVHALVGRLLRTETSPNYTTNIAISLLSLTICWAVIEF